MDGLKSLNLEHWWKLMAAAGALIAIASAPASFSAGFAVGVGLLLFGVGEWSMVRRYHELVPATFNTPAGIRWIVVREQAMFGLILDGLGILLFAFGFYRLLTA